MLIVCLLWCDAAQGEAVAAGVVPVDPGGGFAFDLAPIAPGAGVAGARLVVDEFCFVQGVQRLGQGVNPFKQKTDTQTIKHAPWLILVVSRIVV